ncbi:ATP-binding protein [Thiomicrorhabdus aquaedulcis]|uniref:ATP-binding protein n=1 Tax=Thiomicrorhabdus aquaedulcis TaxID=2211106 RepID=UPI000FD7F130|nr:ATP-binding protein [Thiomicrorhabdus aquaedulcis]
MLKNQGWLTLVCLEPLDQIFLKDLGAVCDKLATSIQSCHANKQLVEQEKKLQTTLMDLERAQAARDLFLANMSHEIRTPLNGIIGFLNQLKSTLLDEQQQHYLKIVEHSSDSLLGIINEVLDFSKMDAGKLALDEQTFHLIDTFSMLVELFQSKAQENDSYIEFKTLNSLPAYLLGDALRLKQIVSNLISNAVKFTHHGKITFTLSCLELKDDQAWLKIAVEDTGIGIAQQKLAFIGEPFIQADSSTSREYGGTGLGLAISKRLIALHGGELKIESELNKGSCFSFSWHAKVTQTPGKSTQRLSAVEHTKLQSHYAGKQILLVEDNKVNQMLMQAILSKLKLVPDVAENGQQAVDKVKQAATQYDLIFMDINMPIMGGEQACELIRAYQTESLQQATPIIALTANALKGDRERYLAEEFSDVLAKPIEMNELNRVLMRYLHSA